MWNSVIIKGLFNSSGPLKGVVYSLNKVHSLYTVLGSHSVSLVLGVLGILQRLNAGKSSCIYSTIYEAEV